MRGCSRRGKIGEHSNQHGFGNWAVEVPGLAEFIGFVGLSVPRFQAHFNPCVEIGWRLSAFPFGLAAIERFRIHRLMQGLHEFF